MMDGRSSLLSARLRWGFFWLRRGDLRQALFCFREGVPF
jgi:hypothetical protein